MADENVTSTEATATTAEAPSPAAAGVGAGPEGGPVPGDPSSEPVATAAQSHVAGRVGPPSIQQDEAAPWHTGEGVTTVAPGTVLPAETPIEGGPVAYAVPDPATFGAGPYGGETPAPAAANVVTQTVPGEGEPTAEELPAGTPQASAVAAKSDKGTGEKGTGDKGDKSTAASGASAAPASPGESSTSSTGPGSGDATEPADSDADGSSKDSAEGDERSDSASSAESGTESTTAKSKR